MEINFFPFSTHVTVAYKSYSLSFDVYIFFSGAYNPLFYVSLSFKSLFPPPFRKHFSNEILLNVMSWQ